MLVRTPLSKRDYVRYGVDTFRDRGLPVIVADLTDYLHPDYNKEFPATERASYNRVIRISNVVGLARFVMGHRDYLFVDHATMAAPDLVYLRLLLWLLRAHCLAVETNFVPNVRVSLRASEAKSGLFAALGRLGRGLRYPRRGLAALVKARYLSSRTVAVVCGRAAERYALSNGADEVISAHTMDYDLYLRLERLPKPSERRVVFLDEYFPHHPDIYIIEGRRTVAADRYYSDMREFFTKIEAAIDCTVVIAAHPRANYREHDPRYGGREVFFGRTAELVASARLVVTHSSTAINFAVIWGKPLLFVTSAEIDQTAHRYYIRDYAAWFGQSAHDVAQCSYDDLRAAVAPPPKEKYALYRDEFIKMPGSPERPLWEIVVDHLTSRSVLEPQT